MVSQFLSLMEKRMLKVRIGVAPGSWDWINGRGFFFEFVDAIEELGWDSLWLSDRLNSERISLEPISALAAVAGRTEKIKFGTSVLALSIRNPAILAKSIATVDYLSGGRFLPAVGLGSDDLTEYEATGRNKVHRAPLTDEAIAILRRLWTENSVTHHGKFFQFDNLTIEPKPLFKPHLPIWIGGRTPKAWSRVARLGDGWIASSVTPNEVREGIQYIRAESILNNRKIDDDHYGVLIPVYLADTKEEALKKIQINRAPTRNNVAITEYAAVGNPDDILNQIGEYVAAGASKFVLRLACQEKEAFFQLRNLSESISSPIHSGQILYGSSV